MNYTDNNLNITFRAKNPSLDDIKAIKRFTNCGLDGLEKKLINSINQKAPNLLEEVNGQKFPKKDTPKRVVISGLKSFFGMPMLAVDAIAKKFPNSSLNNSKFLTDYRNSIKLDEEVRALQGLYSNGMDALGKYMPKGGKYPTGNCDSYCKSICNPVKGSFNEALNDAMADNTAKYDTKVERFIARIASGFTAAAFLGNDFYNKSIQKGRTEEEAKKEQHLKQFQEIKENICEGITQFAVFACFSKTVNSSVMATALIGTAIGLVSRVISRVTSKMPIRRMEVPKQINYKTPTMDKVIKNAKKGDALAAFDNKIEQKEESKKKPILSIRNILLFCALSIAGGYALRFGKKHTKIGQQINILLENHKNKIKSETIVDVVADKSTINKICEILYFNNEEKLSLNIKESLINFDKSGNIKLGTDYKTTKFLGAEVKTKDLKVIKTAPFKFMKELISYPYKIVSKFEEAIKNAGKKKIEKPKDLEDIYDIKNLYIRFCEFDSKYGDDPKKLSEEFGKYVKQMRLRSNNEVTKSKGDNSKIAVLAQTLGTLTGIWFSMNDEFNSAARNGSTKQQAEKDARLRGINKFFRMTVQVIISGTLNGMFSKQYNNSLAKAAAVVAVSTILTDAAARVLTGMPTKKMTKEELDKYQKDYKEGFMSGYYKLIDKLAE